MSKVATIDSWDNIVKNYLKAENLKSSKGFFVAENIEVIPSVSEDGKEQNKIEIETFIGKESYVFVPNYTNTKLIKSQIKAPKDVIGKKLYYEKIKVRNPNTNTMVDSISIVSVGIPPVEQTEEVEEPQTE